MNLSISTIADLILSFITKYAGLVLSFTAKYAEYAEYAPMCTITFAQLSGIDQILKIFQTKQTKNVSPTPFLAMIMSCTLWIYYSYLIKDSVVLITNCTGLICGSLYFAIFCLYTTELSRRKYIGKLITVLAFLFAIFIECPWIFSIHPEEYKEFVVYACWLTTFILMSSPLASMGKVISDKNTKSMSLIMSIGMTTNGLTWALYAYFIKQADLLMFVPNAAGAIAGLIQLLLFCIYPSSTKFVHEYKAISDDSLF